MNVPASLVSTMAPVRTKRISSCVTAPRGGRATGVKLSPTTVRRTLAKVTRYVTAYSPTTTASKLLSNVSVLFLISFFDPN